MYLGKVERDAGLIEFMFADGLIVWFDVGPDGESLVVIREEWIDPFKPPLIPENEEYVRTHGKYTAFDVSGEFRYRDMIGHVVSEARPVYDPDTSKQIALSIRANSIFLCIEAVADDLFVSFSECLPQ